MKRNGLLWLCAVLMLVVGMSSCSSDDDIYRKDMIGTWQLVHSYGGWSPRVDYDPGEVTFTFTADGEVKIVNKRNGYSPFPTGIYDYSFVKIERSIFTGEPETVLLIDCFPDRHYSFNYEDGLLYLSLQAYDGDGYALKKVD